MCRVGRGVAVPAVPRRVFMGVCSWFRLAVVQGLGGFPTRRTRALRRALRISCTRAVCAAWASVSVRMAAAVARPSPAPRSDGSRRRGTGWSLWGSLPSTRVGGWPPVAAGRPNGTSTSPSSPWCAASGAEPTARGSRGHGLGATCRLSPDTMAVRGSRGWLWGRGVGPSGSAALAGSIESTASRLQWHSCGCGVTRTW